MTATVLLFFLYKFTSSWKSLVCWRVVVVVVFLSRSACSHWSAAVSRLDTRRSQQRSGVRQRWGVGSRRGGEGGRGDAEAQTEFDADLSGAGERHHYDVTASPVNQRHQPTHWLHTGTTGINRHTRAENNIRLSSVIQSTLNAKQLQQWRNVMSNIFTLYF